MIANYIRSVFSYLLCSNTLTKDCGLREKKNMDNCVHSNQFWIQRFINVYKQLTPQHVGPINCRFLVGMYIWPQYISSNTSHHTLYYLGSEMLLLLRRIIWKNARWPMLQHRWIFVHGQPNSISAFDRFELSCANLLSRSWRI